MKIKRDFKVLRPQYQDVSLDSDGVTNEHLVPLDKVRDIVEEARLISSSVSGDAMAEAIIRRLREEFGGDDDELDL